MIIFVTIERQGLYTVIVNAHRLPAAAVHKTVFLFVQGTPAFSIVVKQWNSVLYLL